MSVNDEDDEPFWHVWDNVVSPRVFRWSEVDWPWWKPVCLAGIRGGDENCNRTVGVRWGRGAWFICVNVPLRQKPCKRCLPEIGEQRVYRPNLD